MEEPVIKGVRSGAHAYILSAQDPETALRRAKQLAAGLICEQGGGEPCGHCRHCRKALAGIHPDIIVTGRLDDGKGRQKREIGVDQIRQLAADAVVLPNEAGRKVYILHEADTMNLSAQNAALKLLEEPPAGAVFLLTAVNVDRLLPTVRSRCAEISLNGERSEADEEAQTMAREYLKAVSTGDPAKLYAWCAANEGTDQAGTAAFLNCAGELAADMLCGRAPRRGLGTRDLAALAALLNRCAGYLRVNVGVKHVFGLLAVDSIAGSGNRGKEL